MTRTDPMTATPVEQLLEDCRALQRGVDQLGFVAEEWYERHYELVDAVQKMRRCELNGMSALVESLTVDALLARSERQRRLAELGRVLVEAGA